MMAVMINKYKVTQMKDHIWMSNIKWIQGIKMEQVGSLMMNHLKCSLLMNKIRTRCKKIVKVKDQVVAITKTNQ